MVRKTRHDRELESHFKKVVEKKLELCNLTRYMLSKMIGMSSQHLYITMADHNKFFTGTNLIKIMIALEIDAAELISGKVYKIPEVLAQGKTKSKRITKERRKLMEKKIKDKERKGDVFSKPDLDMMEQKAPEKDMEIREVSVGADGKPLTIKYYE